MCATDGTIYWKTTLTLWESFPECGQMFIPESSLAGLKAVHVTLVNYFILLHMNDLYV